MIFFTILLLTIFAFLTLRNLETGILLLCALLPSYLIRFSIGGIPTTFLEVMVLVVIGVWGIKKSHGVMESWSEGRGQFFSFFKIKKLAATITPRLHNSTTPPLFLLLLAATIGIFISPDKLAAIGVWKAFYVEPVLMFFVLVDVMGGHKTRPYEHLAEKIFLALGASALLISIFGLIQYFFSIGIPAPWDLEHRITSVFDYPNALALFLEPIIVISWFRLPPLYKGRGGLPSEASAKAGVGSRCELFFWLLVSILSTLNVFLAESEAGIAALVVTALCSVFPLLTKEGARGRSAVKRTRFVIFATLLIASALVLTIPTSRNYLVEKLTFRDSSEQVRLSQWKETIELLRDRPVFGAGLSGYPIVMKQYHHDLQYEIFQYPHNIVLNIWVELGLLGLMAVGWLMFEVFKTNVMESWSRGVNVFSFFNKTKKIPLPSLHHSITPPLFLFLFLEIVLHGLVDVPYFKNDLAMMTWVLIACMIASYPRGVRGPRL